MGALIVNGTQYTLSSLHSYDGRYVWVSFLLLLRSMWLHGPKHAENECEYKLNHDLSCKYCCSHMFFCSPLRCWLQVPLTFCCNNDSRKCAAFCCYFCLFMSSPLSPLAYFDTSLSYHFLLVSLVIYNRP